MTALTADRVQLRERDLRQISLPVAAGVLIYAGALVAINGDGYATPGAAATGLIGVGVAAARADNSLGSAGDIKVEVRRGFYRFHNSAAADLIALTDIGAACYMVDDQTVALTDGSGTRSVAGMVADVDAGGVWIQFLNGGALTPTAIAAALGGTPVLADGSVPFTGDVGIGVTPAAKLDINGTIAATGAELLTNGGFTGNANGWTLGNRATYANNAVTVLHSEAGGSAGVQTDFASVAGATYLLTFTVSGLNGDAPYFYFWNNSKFYHQGPFQANGVHTVAFTTNFTGTETFSFDSWGYNTGGTWTIDNVSLKEVVLKPAIQAIGYDGSKVISLGGDVIKNCSVGRGAGASLAGGSGNTFFGDAAGQYTSTGSENTAVGGSSLICNTSGQYNTAVGSLSLLYNTSGSYNTAVGESALYGNTTAVGNAAVGAFALGQNRGERNAAVGYSVLYSNTTGSYNTAFGQKAGYGASPYTNANTTGSSNVFVGYQSVGAGAADTNEIVIGANAVGLGSNTTAVGNSSTVSTTLHGVTITPPKTVATLPAPAAGLTGARSFVTDSNATMTAGIGAVVAGGGTDKVPVYCDGAAWRIG